MAGVFQGLADYLFGTDPIDDSARQQMEAHLAAQARDYAAREQADYVHQSNYGRMLLDQISGQTPSTAGLQLGAGLDAIGRQQQSTVAGATGNNASLANYGALLNGGNLASQFNQQKAIQRAQEVQSAQNQLGTLYNAMGSRSAGLSGVALQTGLGYGQLGTEAAIARQKQQAASVGTLLSTAGAIGGAIVGGPGGAYAGSKLGGAVAGAGQGAASDPNGAAYSQAMPGYEASNINYGQALTTADQPGDPYQASYADGIYRSPSYDRGQR